MIRQNILSRSGCGCGCGLSVFQQAALAAEEIAEWIQKASLRSIDITTPEGLERAAVALTRSFAGLTNLHDREAVKRAVRALDVDWRGMTAKQRRTLIDRASKAALLPQGVRTKIGTELDKSARDLLRSAKEGTSRKGIPVSAEFSKLDEKMVKHLGNSHVNFVTDEYRRRSAAVDAKARSVVEAGLASGLGSEEIAERLERVVGPIVQGRSAHYWRTTASAYVTRARSFGQMSSYAGAGITRYTIVSVVDERTTEICRFLDGKTFSTSDSLKQFAEAAKSDSPEAVKTINPWVRERLNSDGELSLYAGDTRIVDVKEPGIGTTSPGQYEALKTDQQMQNLGVSFPPYHGLCRTTTVADVESISAVPVTPDAATPAVSRPRRTVPPRSGKLSQRKALAIIAEEKRDIEAMLAKAQAATPGVDPWLVRRRTMDRLRKDLIPSTRPKGGDTVPIDTALAKSTQPKVLTRVRRFFAAFGKSTRKGQGRLGFFRSERRAWHLDSSELRTYGSGGRRGFAVASQDPRASVINIGQGVDEATIWHEMGHWLEHHNKRSRDAAEAFFASRTRGEASKRLRDITGHAAYAVDEIAKEDKFWHAYVGKIYESGDTEVISMGVQQFVNAGTMSSFWRDDPDHFALIVALLRGRFGWR